MSGENLSVAQFNWLQAIFMQKLTATKVAEAQVEMQKIIEKRQCQKSVAEVSARHLARTRIPQKAIDKADRIMRFVRTGA